jgi:adenosylhomocysteine nucleosidase
MKFLILGAMDEEIQTYLQQLDNLTCTQVQHLEVHSGNINEHEVYVARCGIGKVASALAAGILIQAYNPDLVINSGSAGGFAPELNVGDIVVATNLIQHDVNLTHFGYELGQPAGMPAVFEMQKDWQTQALSQVRQIGIHGMKGLIISGDAFIGTDEQSAQLMSAFPTAVAVEMEGAAIAQVCHILQTDCLVIRAISDHANKASTMTFEEYLPLAAKHSAQIVLGLIHHH